MNKFRKIRNPKSNFTTFLVNQIYEIAGSTTVTATSRSYVIA